MSISVRNNVIYVKNKLYILQVTPTPIFGLATSTASTSIASNNVEIQAAATVAPVTSNGMWFFFIS